MCLCLIIILKGHCIIIISSHGFGVHSSIHPKQEEDLPFSDHALQQVTIEKRTALNNGIILEFIVKLHTAHQEKVISTADQHITMAHRVLLYAI